MYFRVGFIFFNRLFGGTLRFSRSYIKKRDLINYRKYLIL